jgi:phosphoribosylformimino-5-aminoimidazole carboxamide ribotide isomerase
MIIFPAIDLRNGRCVRLVEGRLDNETVFSDDPAAMARQWAGQGAEYLHVVDLDGAFAGAPQNLAVVKAIVDAVQIPVQLGGGIRSLATVDEVLKTGVSRVILGTSSVSQPDMVAEAVRRFGAERIVVGIDARDGKVALQGWVEKTEIGAVELAQQMASLGIKHIIFTDIARDGKLQGPNLASIEEMSKALDIGVIASGGVSSIVDIQALKKLESTGVEGIIVGKAIYTGAVNLAEALAVAKGK